MPYFHSLIVINGGKDFFFFSSVLQILWILYDRIICFPLYKDNSSVLFIQLFISAHNLSITSRETSFCVILQYIYYKEILWFNQESNKLFKKIYYYYLLNFYRVILFIGLKKKKQTRLTNKVPLESLNSINLQIKSGPRGKANRRHWSS